MAIYIGGDTQELEYNFLTKVAGSMTECPMKCYWVRASDLLAPSDSLWKEFNQENYGYMKAQDLTSAMMDATIVGEKPQFLIELDLNGLCNSYYGGSNSVLKGNMKNIWVGCYGVNVDGWQMYVRDSNTWTKWAEGKQEYLYNNSNSTYPYTTDNKVYILLAPLEPANSTTPSKLYLDYIDIKLKINRQADRIEPIDMELGEEWSLLFKGVSYNWDNTATDKYLFWLVGTSKENIAFRYINNNIGRLTVQYDSQYLTSPNAPTLRTKKWECNNYLIQYKNNIYTCYHLDSQGLRKITFTDNVGFKKGIYKLYLCQHTGYGYQADAFIPDIPIKYNQTFSDEEAEIILKSKNPNIVPNFNNGDWYIHPNASTNLEGTILTLVATANYQGSSIVLPILPNNRYKIDVEIEDINNLAHVAITQRCNNTNISTTRVFDNSGNYTGEFITQDKINTLVIACQNTGTGTFKFKNLKLRRLD
ncbi:hypothetical protein [Clostridium sporogenes]|uniref:hypothetical protein n=1 Tax=Clostridium sporogenes TaxID=1509 RepID=UPI0013CF9823|nr:hypothetical protein [Clostridium sporogenes]NFP92422.1 hypothetical protein [Clostridium sporogenes]